MIAEDDRATAQLLATRLNQWGHETVLAFDSLQTMMVCMRNRPDALILDVQMPAGNGLQVLRRLKVSRHTAMLPVIVLTAHPEHEQAALEAGADAFLQKPPDFQALQAILDRFYVRPAEPERVQALRSPERPAARSHSIARNILLVEGDRMVAGLVAQALKRGGYATVFAPALEEALKVLSAFRIDAVVLDMQAPGGNCPEAIQRLRACCRAGDLPILVVSETPGEQAAELALAAGADSYFPKPPDLETVIARLDAHFRPRHAEERDANLEHELASR